MNPLRTHFWAPKGEGDDWEQPVWIYPVQIMPHQPDCYANMAGFVDEAKVVDVIYLDFCKTFCTVSHNICVWHLGH